MVNRNPVIRSGVTREKCVNRIGGRLRSQEDKNNLHDTYHKQKLAPRTSASSNLLCQVISAFYTEYCRAILK